MWFEDVAELGWALAAPRTRRRVRCGLRHVVFAVLLASTYRVGSVDRLVEHGFNWYVNEKATEAGELFREMLEPMLPATAPSGEPTSPN